VRELGFLKAQLQKVLSRAEFKEKSLKILRSAEFQNWNPAFLKKIMREQILPLLKSSQGRRLLAGKLPGSAFL